MTKEELAIQLNGREYRREITPEEEAKAKAAGLVVVFGASDDLMEFRGAIRDEVGCYDGGVAHLNADGLLVNECDDEDCPLFEKLKGKAAVIEAVWASDPYSWTFNTAIPHATFEVAEDDESYCRGIVFALSDVGLAMKQ